MFITVLLFIVSIWTVLWFGTCLMFHFSEYGTHITWHAYFLAYFAPIILVYRLFYAVESDPEKILEQTRKNNQ